MNVQTKTVGYLSFDRHSYKVKKDEGVYIYICVDTWLDVKNNTSDMSMMGPVWMKVEDVI